MKYSADRTGTCSKPNLSGSKLTQFSSREFILLPCDEFLDFINRTFFKNDHCVALLYSVCKVLVAWFDFLVKNPELGLSADLIVYLQTSPEVSYHVCVKTFANIIFFNRNTSNKKPKDNCIFIYRYACLIHYS
jgi:hypothetical protein